MRVITDGEVGAITNTLGEVMMGNHMDKAGDVTDAPNSGHSATSPRSVEVNMLMKLHCRRAREDEFRKIFRAPLSRYWNSLLGFDMVKFDEELVKPKRGHSTADAVKRKYGDRACDLIRELIGN